MTPEQVTSWWSVIETGGLPLVLLIIVLALILGIRRVFQIVPGFLAQWAKWTDAVEKVNERLENIERWCKTHDGTIDGN